MNSPQTQDQTAVSLKPNICYFGTVPDSGKQKTFGILQEDRRKHTYIVGKTGMGKTTLLQNMVLQDIYNGAGVCFIDPHGDSSEYILDRVPPHRQKDIVYFNPADTDFPVGLNMLEPQRGEEPFLITSGLIAVFHRLWAGMWSARMEYILNNTLLALLETPGHTLLSVIQMLTDNDYRKNIVQKLRDPLVKNFWQKEFANFNERYRQEAISPILNKIGQFLATDLVRNIVGQEKSTIDFRKIMDERKILIVNLAKGRLGEDNSHLLGSLIVTKLQLAALSRVDIPEEKREDFYLYVDEFQNFTTDSFGVILSEARKYRLNLILAHQYISQLTETGNDKLQKAIFGNVGSIIAFRVGSEDAQILSQEFAPVFQNRDLIGLDRTQIALSLSIRDKKSAPFLANTLAPIFDKINGRMASNIDFSRKNYGTAKQDVVQKIAASMAGKTKSGEAPALKPSAQTDSSQTAVGQKYQSLNYQTQEFSPTLPILPNTNLNIPSTQKTSGNLESLKKARSQARVSTPSDVISGNLPQIHELEDTHSLFNLP